MTAETRGAEPGKTAPCISVVVPFHNSERFLASCIDSLLAQDDVGGTVEIIVIDNGSTDGAASIAARYDELILLEESSPGAYAARNTGIRHAHAPVIAFTDADCVVAHDWLRTIREGMQDSGVAVLLGSCHYPEQASMPLRMLAVYENAKTDYTINRCPAAHHFAYANNMAVRAAVFEEIGLFEEWQRAADSELIHRLAQCRPDLRPAYHPPMRVTHLEFLRARDRARRLRLYTRTNARIETFKELGVAQRLGLMAHLLTRSRRNR
jgi:glycosyltransferase involved in cell wall biosynthesis